MTSGAGVHRAAAASFGVTGFYPITAVGLAQWQQRVTPSPTSTYPAHAATVYLYLGWQGAIANSDQLQVVVYDSGNHAVATGNTFTLQYAAGSTVVNFSAASWPVGAYHATVLLDPNLSFNHGLQVGHTSFTIGTPPCVAHDPHSVGVCDSPSVVRLVTPNGIFTGFVVQSDGTGTYLLTMRRAVDGIAPSSVLVSAPGGLSTHATAVQINNANIGSAGGLAVVRLPSSNLTPLHWSLSFTPSQRMVGIGYGDNAPPRAPALVLGTVDEMGIDIGDGFGSVWIRLDSALDDSFGGSPICDYQGGVAGVAMHTFTSRRGVFFAVPASLAQRIANALIGQLQGQPRGPQTEAH